MVVIKILEKTLQSGQTSITFTDSDLPNSLIRVYSDDPDLMPVTMSMSGTTLTITYEAQGSNKGVAVEMVKSGLEIVDNLVSTDDEAALSAKQGKILKDIITSRDITDVLTWNTTNLSFNHKSAVICGNVININVRFSVISKVINLPIVLIPPEYMPLKSWYFGSVMKQWSNIPITAVVYTLDNESKIYTPDVTNIEVGSSYVGSFTYIF